MKASARPRRRKTKRSLTSEALAAVGRAVAERPVGVGAATAFAITFAFVSANALWYQPHAHTGAFFETRERLPRGPADPVEVTRLEIAPAETAPAPVTPPQVAPAPIPSRPASAPRDTDQPVIVEVQEKLAALELYPGAIDGLAGPQTDAAVSAYRQRAGLAAEGGIDDALLRHIRARAVSQPDAGALDERAAAADQIQTASAPQDGGQRIMRIQAGLRAFGNQGIDLDGKVGPRTRDALLEFQGLFGLQETGAPDEATYAKMREIGLAN